MRRALVVAAMALVGCSSVRKCVDKTVLVTLTVDAAARAADRFGFDVSIDGGAPVHSDVGYSGAASGTLQIEFPSGYPSGKLVQVSVQATRGGAPIGAGSGSLRIAHGCELLSVAVAPLNGAGDLAGLDAAAPSNDLALADAQPRDFYGIDLIGVEAGSCVATGPEQCFNGIDDDCNGLIDCADPACTGGGNPPAQCAPDPGSATPGLFVTDGGCPAQYPSPSPLNAGIQSTCGLGTCGGCSPYSSSYCQLQIFDNGSDSACTAGTGSVVAVVSTGSSCTALTSTIPNGNYHSLGSPSWGGTCAPPGGGSAVKNTPTWTQTAQFCSGASVGRGCPVGFVCLPATGKHCALAAGTQVACPSSYQQNTTSFFGGFDDTTRSCTCDCAVGGTGSCSGTPSVRMAGNSGCGGGTTNLQNGCGNLDVSTYQFARLQSLIINNPPPCTDTTRPTGTTNLTGPQTVCCTP
jgi:hypothetical protein